VQHVEQLLYVVEVQACSRLIEQVESFCRSGACSQFAGQLNALRFAAGERDRRLTEDECSRGLRRPEFAAFVYLRNVFENGQRVGDRASPANRRWNSR